MTYRIQNPSMRNSIITTNYGVFRFNSEGIINNAPYGLAEELLQLEGFTLIDDEGNEIELPETDPDAGTPTANNSVTLSGGEVWTTIPGGYTIQDSNSVYTLIGSAFDYNPPEVSLQAGSLVFGTGIDTSNVHAVGVDSGTTIQVGTNVFTWQDTDENMDNGYELVLTETIADTLPLNNDGFYYKIENGYVVGDDSMTYTISGDFFDSDTISIDHGALVFSAGVDTSSIHVIGVDSDSTLQIGDFIYKWADTNNNLADGYELTPYVEEPEPTVTLPAGWSTINGGYIIDNNETMYTLMGNFDTSEVSIKGTTFYFGEGVDTSSVHIVGVDSDSTVYVGTDTYVWKDTDNNSENGYELTPYVEPTPEIHTLPGGANWYTDGNNVIISDTSASYTLVGAQVVDSDTVALNSGVLSFGNNIDTDAIHVLGVESGTTVAVGNDTFQWVEADLNSEDGLELIHYVAPIEVHTLRSGATYDTIEGGYIVSDTGVTYTLKGGAFDEGIEDVVDIQSGTFVFDSSVTTSDVHIQGIAADTTLKVGEDTYIFKELNNNPDDGMEIEPYVPPVTIHTLPSGATYESIEGGYVVSDTTETYTLTGVAFVNGLEGIVDVQSGTFVFGTSIDTLDVHVAGVSEDDTLYVGDTAFIWKNTDEDTENGLEIAEIPEPVVTLPAGWTAIDGGFAYDDGITVVTITGVDLDANNHLPVDIGDGGMVVFDEGINPTDVHAIGVYTGDVLKIGENSYQWVNTDSNPLNGLEVADLPVQPTLPAGWSTIDSGLTYTSDTTTFTILGVGLNDDNSLPVTVDGGTIFFEPTVSTDGIHVQGVNANDTLMVGQETYVFQELDGNIENGFEITPYIAPPTVYELPNGGNYSTVEGGYVVFDDTAQYTLTGSTIDEDNTAVQSGTLIFGTGIDTDSLHILGVESDTTIQIGGNTYIWKDTDSNLENGYELELFVPKTGGTLPSGATWDTISGGYTINDGTMVYTLTGTTFNEGIEGLVDIQSDTLTFSTNVDTIGVHVQGVNENDTLYVGDTALIWKDTDDNAENGYEIAEIPTPQPILPAGWATVEGGLVYDNRVTIMGATVNEDGTVPITVEEGTFIFDDTVDISSIHAQGVLANDTLKVGDLVYRWADTDSNPDNGYEIAETIAPAPSNWSTIDGGFIYLDDYVSYTLMGSNLGTGATPDGVQVVNGYLELDTNVNINDLHVKGVQPNSTITIGTNAYIWKDLDGDLSNGYELELVEPAPILPDGWATIDNGLIYNNAITITGATLNEDGTLPVVIDGDTLVFNDSIAAEDIHVQGVNANDTLKVGDSIYRWADMDNNLENGYEIAATITPGPWYPITNGFTYHNGSSAYTLTGSAFGNGSTPQYADVVNNTLVLEDGIDVSNVHVVGVNENDTIQIGTNSYAWKNLDDNTRNGYELELIEPNMPLPAGWGTIDGGLTYISDTTAVTISGITVENGSIPVAYKDGGFIFSEGIDTDAVHAIGVNASDTVQVESAVYIWTDRDNNPDNGLEITTIPDTTPSGDDTIPPDTIVPDPTIPADTVNGFSYDFDGVAFTVKGGIDNNISIDDLNENAKVEADGLEFGAGIISTLGSVHITGLQSGTTVKVAGENYTLMDADGDLSNGYELVGGEADAYNWKRTNRSAGIYEPQIWRHYLNDTATILVIGCTARPLYENNVLTVLGNDIKVVSNEAAPDFTIAGDIYGKLTTGVGFDSNVGIINGDGTSSYVVQNHMLYLPGTTLSGIKNDKIEFMVTGTMITIINGAIDVESTIVTGTNTTSILYNNKKYYVNKTTGKLVRNAWQRG